MTNFLIKFSFCISNLNFIIIIIIIIIINIFEVIPNKILTVNILFRRKMQLGQGTGVWQVLIHTYTTDGVVKGLYR